MGEEFVTRVPREHIAANRLDAARALSQKILEQIDHRRAGRARVLNIFDGIGPGRKQVVGKNIPIERETIDAWKKVLRSLVDAIPPGTELRKEAEKELQRIYADDQQISPEGRLELNRLWDAGAEE